jgi:hypothetical protein
VVDEYPIKPNEGGNFSTVRPGELTVFERELNEGQVIDAIVEKAGIGLREVVIVSVSGIPSEVEVSGDNPRGGITRVVSGEITEERGLLGVVARGVDVSETKDRTINMEGEIQREDVTRGDRKLKGEDILIPG